MKCWKEDKENQLLTTTEAAKLLAFTQKALEGMRWRGEGPPYVKIGRSVRYRYCDLITFIEKRIRA